MDQFLSQAVSQRRLNMLLLAVFAAIATILAAIGIYGVMAYAVTQRSHEIGIRMALGAEPSDVLKMVVSDGMKLAVIGLADRNRGRIAPHSLSREPALRNQDNGSIYVCGSRSRALRAVAAAACYFPARRATKVDPLSALRHD